MRTIRYLMLATATMVLAACGGGGGGGDQPTPAADPLAAVPAETATSAEATITWQTQLASQNDNAASREPIDLSGVTLATSDTTEPIAF